MVQIYTLSDPETREIRYVGKTKSGLERRLYMHCFVANKVGKKNHREAWIFSLLRRGLRPVIEELDNTKHDDWMFLEQFWIAQCKVWGFRLTNSTNGGEDAPVGFSFKGRRHSDITKNKIAEKNTGRKASEKTKQKQSLLRKGKPFINPCPPVYGEDWQKIHPPHTRKSWVNVKNHSDEARKKISDSKKGKPAKNKGVPQSEESRLKMSVSKKGKPSSFKGKTLSEGSRLKISNAKKGKPTWNKGVTASDDARRKMSEAAKRRYSK